MKKMKFYWLKGFPTCTSDMLRVLDQVGQPGLVASALDRYVNNSKTLVNRQELSKVLKTRSAFTHALSFLFSLVLHRTDLFFPWPIFKNTICFY